MTDFFVYDLDTDEGRRMLFVDLIDELPNNDRRRLAIEQLEQAIDDIEMQAEANRTDYEDTLEELYKAEEWSSRLEDQINEMVERIKELEKEAGH